MSSFRCEHCGTAIIDTPVGIVTECAHYRKETKSQDLRRRISNIESTLRYIHETQPALDRELAYLRRELEKEAKE